MTMIDLDHVNIRTGNLAEMRRFYRDALGLEDGERPNFRFDGAWLYVGKKAAVHLVDVANTPESKTPKIEHFAFQASGLANFLDRLREMKVAYRISIVPGPEIRQVNIFDPDGNHIEVAFQASEEADLSDFAG